MPVARSPVDILHASGAAFSVQEHAPITGHASAERELGLPSDQMLKTMVFRAGAATILVALPAHGRVHYGKLARAVGVPRGMLRRAEPDDLARIGMMPGGASPVCDADGVIIVFDVSVLEMGTVYCGSGRADQTVQVEAKALIDLVRPVIAAVTGAAGGVAVGGTVGWQGKIRRAGAADADSVATLAAELVMSFEFSEEAFRASYPGLLASEDACLLLADNGHENLGYLLGFRHLTFYSNGPVGWVEEIVVRHQDRGQGVGRLPMNSFEQWAAEQGCALVALATRRAAPFYHALGYEESATYFRKLRASAPPRTRPRSEQELPGHRPPTRLAKEKHREPT